MNFIVSCLITNKLYVSKGYQILMIVQTKFLNCTTTGRLLNVEILWLSFQQKGVNALVLAQKGGLKNS